MDFGHGKITYWEFSVDFSKSFEDQLEYLTEDLVQVEYPGGYLVDIGWYPEYDADGEFIVQLIRLGNWGTPEYRCRTRTREGLQQGIETALAVMERNMPLQKDGGHL